MTRAAALRRLLMELALACAAGACAKHESTAPAAAPPPPEVVQMFPAARATGVPYHVVIWAQFREPLDPRTVNDRTVFLKVDTQRIPIQVALADSARRVELHPMVDLAVRRTHTVEFTSSVRTKAGATFPSTWFWQFTTVSVRRPEAPQPPDGRAFESPYTPLFWQGTEASAGPVSYTVTYGRDSAQVAAGTASQTVVGSDYLLPNDSWDTGTTWFWKVGAVNQETGDHDEGRVWRFHTAPGDAPVDSLAILPLDASTWDNTRKVWRCDVLASGPNSVGVVRYLFPPADSSLVVARAHIAFFSSNPNPNPNAFPEIWQGANALGYCVSMPSTTPKLASDGLLAPGVHDETGHFVFSSARLTAQIQARLRQNPEFFDYVVVSQATLQYTSSALNCGVVITYYKTPGAMARTGVR